MKKKRLKLRDINLSTDILNINKTRLIFKRLEKIKKRRINIKNPKTFREKLNWIILFDNIPIKTKLADKIKVCDFCKKRLGIDLCVPKYKEYNRPEDINFDELPKEFVIKTNHGCGKKYYEIIYNKANIKSKKKIIKKFKKALKRYYKSNQGNEPHYYGIKPKLYTEMLLDGKNDPKDYKIWCRNGEVDFYTIVSDRSKPTYHGNWYDKNNKFINIGLQPDRIRPDLKDKLPENINLMLEYAKKLSLGFKHVRIDFYNIKGKIYLGEMTFTTHDGLYKFKKNKDEIGYGKMIDLNLKNSIFSDYNEEYLIKLDDTDIKVPISNFM